MAAAEMLVLDQDRELAAFDAGLAPEQPRVPITPAIAEARNRYRTLTKRAIDLADQNRRRALQEHQLGKIRHHDMLMAELKLVDAKRELAAFEAGRASPRRTESALLARKRAD